MPKALLCKTHDKNSRFKYVTNYHYNLKDGIKVKVQKESSSFAKSAGWGLRAVTAIPNNTCLGSFRIQKKLANAPVVGTYCFPVGDKFKVTHPESLMNKINTIVDKRFVRFINCKVTNAGTVRTIKRVQAGEFLYAKYGTARHKWEIQYYILQKRLRVLKPLSEKDNSCRGCKKRHLTLYVCESCPVAICSSCLSRSEKYILDKRYFFCKDCMVDPPAYMNRFSGKIASTPYQGTVLEKEERWLKNTHRTVLDGGVYCSTFKGSFDLDAGWKCNKDNVVSLFTRADMKRVEFLNMKGSDVNDSYPWDIDVVEALICMLERDRSRVYGINLGEIYFTKTALKYLHDQLHRTWIGWIYIEKDYNVLPKHCFEHTKSCSNIAKNRKEHPRWHKGGKIAPWFDEDKRKFFDRNETMKKCFWSSLSSKHFGTG
jgi:hypothetical protein